MLKPTKGVKRMAFTNVFKRYELKYLLTTQQMEELLQRAASHIKGDEYGKSTICNIYYDTPDSLLIRRSLDKPMYKEKLRLRSYGIAKENTPVFVEIKKKFDGVVYKRRINTSERLATALCKCITPTTQDQITKEILYFIRRYDRLEPAVFLSYDREAFYAEDDGEFRVTFDRNILWRDSDLSLSKGVYGTPILKSNEVLMEVKCPGAMPLWFVEILTDMKLYKTSFSKYGNAYAAKQRKIIAEKKQQKISA